MKQRTPKRRGILARANTPVASLLRIVKT